MFVDFNEKLKGLNLNSKEEFLDIFYSFDCVNPPRPNSATPEIGTGLLVFYPQDFPSTERLLLAYLTLPIGII